MMRPLVLLLALVLASGPVSALTVILYARADEASMQRARSLARAYGPVWVDLDLQPGQPWRRAIAGRLCGADRVLVIWSQAAAGSVELAAEWRQALACGRRVVPVLLDAAPMPPELGAWQAVDWR